MNTPQDPYAPEMAAGSDLELDEAGAPVSAFVRKHFYGGGGSANGSGDSPGQPGQRAEEPSADAAECEVFLF